jgi:hypothetical protein
MERQGSLPNGPSRQSAESKELVRPDLPAALDGLSVRQMIQRFKTPVPETRRLGLEHWWVRGYSGGGLDAADASVASTRWGAATVTPGKFWRV